MGKDGAKKRKRPRVFISYAQDSARHVDDVCLLAEILENGYGIRTDLDQWYERDRRDWSISAGEWIERADFVLAVASPAFRDRADGRVSPDQGRGAQYEGALLRNNLTRDRVRWTRKILPVVLPGRSIDEIPDFLSPYSATHYLIPELTVDGVEDLVRAIAGTAGRSRPPRGEYRPPAEPAGLRERFPEAFDRIPGGANPGTGNRHASVHHSKIDNFSMGDTVHYHGGSRP